MFRWSWFYRGCVLPLCMALWFLFAATENAQDASADRRIALVIGNAAYQAGPLVTATSDAGLVAQALAQAGFDVTAAADTDGATLRKTVREFEESAKRAGPRAVVLVYLSGYGVQFDGDNFFAPVDARIAHADDVPGQTLRLSDLSRAIEATEAGTRIFLFDLAHANPFAKGDAMPLADGLSPVVAVKDSLYAFNAAPGMMAGPDAPPYGVFARALTELIQEPGLPMQAMFDRLRLRVGELTDGALVPWDDSKIDTGFTFYPAADGAPSTTAAPIEDVSLAALSADVAYSAVVARDTLSGYEDFLRTFPRDRLGARVTGLLAARREALTWTEALQADDPRAFWTYMRRYPRGLHLFDARRVLAALHAALEPPPRFDIYDFADLSPPSPREIAFLARPNAIFPDPGWPPIPPPPGAFLPSPRAAFYDDLPPPLPAPVGLLPIAAPLPATDGEGRGLPVESGRIVQADGAGHGRVATKTVITPGGSTLTLMGDVPTRLISRATTTVASDEDRTILQTNARGEILSRTTTVHGQDGLTTIQTGPTGGLITKIIARTEPAGGRSFEVTNDRNALVASLKWDNQGIIVKRDIVAAWQTPGAAEPMSRAKQASSTAEIAPSPATHSPSPNAEAPRPHDRRTPMPPSPLQSPPPLEAATAARVPASQAKTASPATPGTNPREKASTPQSAAARNPSAARSAAGATEPAVTAPSVAPPQSRAAALPNAVTSGRPVEQGRLPTSNSKTPEHDAGTSAEGSAPQEPPPLPPHRPKALSHPPKSPPRPPKAPPRPPKAPLSKAPPQAAARLRSATKHPIRPKASEAPKRAAHKR